MKSLPLKRFVRPDRPITYGIVQAGEDVPGGIPYVRPVDMDGHNGVDQASALRTTSKEIALQYSRSELRPGDIIVSIGPSFGKTMAVPQYLHGANLTQGTARVAPAAGVDPRYLRWALQAQTSTSYWEAAVGGATFRALNLEPLSRTPIPWWESQTQRQIAGFLDVETARIDALIAKKLSLQDLLEERRGGLFEASLTQLDADPSHAVTPTIGASALPAGWRLLSLGRVLRQLTNGYVGPTRDILVDHGVPYIQGMHIKHGRIDFERRPFYVDKQWHEQRPRISLRPGDVLIVQTGDIGQVAVVPEDFGKASCHALLIARPNHSLVSSEYLGLHLQSTIGRNEMLRLATGALHPHLEFGVRAAPVIVPPREEQAAIVEEVTAARRRLDSVSSRLASQLALLRERRRALITEAVVRGIPGR